jgi:hypothetical protein
MERRLEEVDNVICWGVDCVHQAKELDKSYSAFAVREALLPFLPKCTQMLLKGGVTSACGATATKLAEKNEMGVDCKYYYCDAHAEPWMADLPYARIVRTQP